MCQGYAVCCRMLVFVMMISGIVLSCLTLTSCQFVEYTDSAGTDQAAGLFRYLDGDTCVDHTDQGAFDESENAARAGGTIAPIAATCALLLMLFEFLCCRFPCSRLLVGVCLLTAQVFQGLTFLFFNSDQFCDGDIVNEIRHQKPCSIADGSVFSVCALLLFFFSGVILCCTPKPVPLRNRSKDIAAPSSTHSATFPVHSDVEQPNDDMNDESVSGTMT